VLKEVHLTPYTEADYENAVIEMFRDTLGYANVYGPDVVRDYIDPLYMAELLPALRRVNPRPPEAALFEAAYRLRHIEGGTVSKKSARFMGGN
jgi:type I restriction enzyme R subunit